MYSELSSAAHGETISTIIFSREVDQDEEDSVEYHPDMYRAQFGSRESWGLGTPKR
jgi:hypothetical protein